MKEMNKSVRGIAPGAPVVIVLHAPREKCWGVLDEISTAGVFLRGLDLNAFDDWLKGIVSEEAFISLGDLFFPMWRVERISRDETSGGVPSLRDQAERRTGRTLEELVSVRQ
jgi:hypothetical protein